MYELTVKYKNELNAIPLRKFNSVEMNLFFSICAKMKNKGTKNIVLTFDELKEVSQYSNRDLQRFVTDLKNVYRKMLQLTYREENEERVKYFTLFTGFTIEKKKRFVEISVNSELEYILNELSNEFTQFELLEFTKLTSSYSKTMYRLLKQYKSTGYYTLKVDDFRELLDIPPSYRMSDINKIVLRPIIEELSAYFEPLEIKKIKAKKGNRIERLEFIFIEKMHEAVGNIPKVTLHNWVDEEKDTH